MQPIDWNLLLLIPKAIKKWCSIMLFDNCSMASATADRSNFCLSSKLGKSYSNRVEFFVCRPPHIRATSDGGVEGYSIICVLCPSKNETRKRHISCVFSMVSMWDETDLKKIHFQNGYGFLNYTFLFPNGLKYKWQVWKENTKYRFEKKFICFETTTNYWICLNTLTNFLLVLEWSIHFPQHTKLPYALSRFFT